LSCEKTSKIKNAPVFFLLGRVFAHCLILRQQRKILCKRAADALLAGNPTANRSRAKIEFGHGRATPLHKSPIRNEIWIAAQFEQPKKRTACWCDCSKLAPAEAGIASWQVSGYRRT
jgi:hypothetical protein